MLFFAETLSLSKAWGARIFPAVIGHLWRKASINIFSHSPMTLSFTRAMGQKLPSARSESPIHLLGAVRICRSSQRGRFTWG